ncbi:MAG: hypothetical protein SX243_20070 [Acidobacteriota bacterium]|nr:hypothetical protein [Acidobacteriota bacterium]
MDPISGLYWLDVPLSTTYSYDGIEAELQAGGLFEGFRLATSEELRELWEHAGIDTGAIGRFVPQNLAPILDLMELVGVTGDKGNLGGGNFFVYTNGYLDGKRGDGWVTVGGLGADPEPTATGRVSFGTVPSDNESDCHGSWLVTNTLSVAKEEPMAPKPFQVMRTFRFGDGSFDEDKTGGVLFRVPKDKRLLVEYTSFDAALATGDHFLSVELNGGLNLADKGLGASHVLIPVAIGSFPSQDIFYASQLMKMFVEPGSNLGFSAWRSSTTHPRLTFIHVTVTGWLLDPSAAGVGME